MRKNGHYDKATDKDNIEISANMSTLKSEMFLKNNYEVNIGFHSNLYTSGFLKNDSSN